MVGLVVKGIKTKKLEERKQLQTSNPGPTFSVAARALN